MSEASGRDIGYVHVSSVDQSVERQLVGVHTNRVVVDHVSGAWADRPALRDLIADIRGVDEVVVHSLDRSARNLDGRRAIVNERSDMGVRSASSRRTWSCDLATSTRSPPWACPSWACSLTEQRNSG